MMTSPTSTELDQVLSRGVHHTPVVEANPPRRSSQARIAARRRRRVKVTVAPHSTVLLTTPTILGPLPDVRTAPGAGAGLNTTLTHLIPPSDHQNRRWSARRSKARSTTPHRGHHLGDESHAKLHAGRRTTHMGSSTTSKSGHHNAPPYRRSA
jgi:hypothetical protein